MPNYAILSSGIRQVAANTLIGNSTGSTGSAEELSATDAKTLLGLGTTDSPQFAKIGIGTAASGSNDITFAPYASISVTGGIVINTDGNYRVGLNYAGRGIQAAKTLPIGWEDATNLGSAASDTKIYRDAAGVIAQRNGTNAQEFRIYNTDDGSQTNYERGSIGWDSNELKIAFEKGGTGSNRSIRIGSGSYGSIRVNDYSDNTGVIFYQAGVGKFKIRPTNLEPSGDNNYGLGTSNRRWSSLYATNSDLSESLTLASHTPATTTNKLYNVGGTLYFNGSAAGGNPFDQNLNTTDSPTFGGLEFPASAIINAASGGLFFQSNGSNIFGYTGGQFTAYKSINPADTSRDLGSIAAGKSWRNLIVGRLASITNVIEQSNGTNAQAFNIYNTYTDASNFERACLKWNSNVFEIAAENGGTGTKREISLLPNSFVKIDAGGLNVKHYGNGLTLGSHGLIFKTGSSREIRIHDGETFSTTTPSVTISGFGATFNDSDGDQVVCSIAPTYNQTGTAGGTDILVNRIEQGVGSGEQNLLDLQVGGTSKFKVDNAGNAVMSGVVNQMTSSASLPSTTEFPNDQDWGIHHDTLNDHIYLAFNKSGSIKKTLIN